MKNNTVRFAVVGAGHMGVKHIQKIFELSGRIGATVTVVVEPDELRAQSLAREFKQQGHHLQVLSNVGSLSQVPSDLYPEAAIVAVPASIHDETTAACLAMGLHVLVEKPLGFSALDCRELEKQAVEAKRILQVGLLERWSLCHLWDNWKPGPGPWTINAVRSGPFVPRAADTDVIHDLMIHDLDLFVLLDGVFGLSPVQGVRAWGRKLRSEQIDSAKVVLDLENGGTAHFFASRLAADASRRWELTGHDWHASIDFMRRSFKRFERGEAAGKSYFEAFENQWTAGDPLGLEIEAFVQRVRGTFESGGLGMKDPIFSFWEPSKVLPTPQNVLRTHEIIDEILSQIKVLA